MVFDDLTTGQIDLTQSKPGTYTVTNTIPASGQCAASVYSSQVVIVPASTVNAGPGQTVAAGSPVQLAGTFSGGSGVLWSGGSGTFSDKTSPTAVYTPAAGESTVTLTLRLVNPTMPCDPKPSSVVISIIPVPPGQTICAGNSASLIATIAGGTYNWYNTANGGNVLSTSAVYTTPVLATTTSYYEQTTVNGIAGPLEQVTVTVNALPATPTVLADSICTGNTATLTATGSTGSYQWFDAAVGGNLLSVGSIYTTPPLFANTSYYVQVTDSAGCTSNTAQVNVTVEPIITITSDTAVNVCSGTRLTTLSQQMLPLTIPGAERQWPV